MSSAANAGQRRIRPVVVFHADDLGLNEDVNRGIIEGFEQGLLTSTSILANAPAASSAVQAWKSRWPQGASHPTTNEKRQYCGDSGAPFDLGVHLNLTQGRPLSGDRYPHELLDGQGRFPGIARLFVRLLRPRACWLPAVRAELNLQIGWLADHGLPATHLNGHQYIELLAPLARLLPELMLRFQITSVRIPIERRVWRTSLAHGAALSECLLALVKRHYARQLAKQARSWPVRFKSAAFYGTACAGRINLSLLRAFLPARMAPLTEIGMHPGHAPSAAPDHADEDWHDPLERGRALELDVLTSWQLAELLRSRGVCLGRLNKVATPRSLRVHLASAAVR